MLPGRPGAAAASGWSGTTSFDHSNLRSEAGLGGGCAARLVELDAVAAVLAQRAQSGATLPETPEVTFELRRRGIPHVRPHGWALMGASWSSPEVGQRFSSWVSGLPQDGMRLCGFAERGTPDSVAAVIVQALGDLAPLPTLARTGQWLTIDARLFVPSTATRVFAVGPSGAPRPIPTRFGDGRARAALAVDQPGRWTVQVLADTAGGPRPVLEAAVFVDQLPPDRYQHAPAPGEEAAGRDPDPARRLEAMLRAARSGAGVPALRRLSELDAVAQEHAEAMRRTGKLAHDVGLGSVQDRLASAGLDVVRAGENVAQAGSAENGHRTLWASPSHRDNILYPRFDSLGIGTARDADGTLWICELFADLQGAELTVARPRGQLHRDGP